MEAPGECGIALWGVCGGCLEGMGNLSGGCRKAVFRMWGGYLEGVGKLSRG